VKQTSSAVAIFPMETLLPTRPQPKSRHQFSARAFVLQRDIIIQDTVHGHDGIATSQSACSSPKPNSKSASIHHPSAFSQSLYGSNGDKKQRTGSLLGRRQVRSGSGTIDNYVQKELSKDTHKKEQKRIGRSPDGSKKAYTQAGCSD
jgi:hypothetical protein